MIADDELGKQERNFEILPQNYWTHLKKNRCRSNQELIVVENDTLSIGTLQLTFYQYLTLSRRDQSSNWSGGVKRQRIIGLGKNTI
jgi:hypothetical protein